jgi:hypothetical protein
LALEQATAAALADQLWADFVEAAAQQTARVPQVALVALAGLLGVGLMPQTFHYPQVAVSVQQELSLLVALAALSLD